MNVLTVLCTPPLSNLEGQRLQSWLSTVLVMDLQGPPPPERRDSHTWLVECSAFSGGLDAGDHPTVGTARIARRLGNGCLLSCFHRISCNLECSASRRFHSFPTEGHIGFQPTSVRGGKMEVHGCQGNVASSESPSLSLVTNNNI